MSKIDSLSAKSRRARDHLYHIPQLADVASDLQDGGLQAYVDIDRATEVVHRSDHPKAEIFYLGAPPHVTGPFSVRATAVFVPSVGCGHL